MAKGNFVTTKEHPGSEGSSVKPRRKKVTTQSGSVFPKDQVAQVGEIKEKPVTKTDEEKLRIVFKKICGFCAHYEGIKTSINAGSTESRYVEDLLRRFSVYLSRSLGLGEMPELSMQVSKARPSMPRVPWVAVLENGTFVANSKSVTVCFGRGGNGAVAGLMYPSSSSVRGDANAIVRSKNTSNVVNVNGNNRGTEYNDKFANPKEFLVSNIDPHELVMHLRESLTKFKQY